MEISYSRCWKDGSSISFCFMLGRSTRNEKICLYSERYVCLFIFFCSLCLALAIGQTSHNQSTRPNQACYRHTTRFF